MLNRKDPFAQRDRAAAISQQKAIANGLTADPMSIDYRNAMSAVNASAGTSPNYNAQRAFSAARAEAMRPAAASRPAAKTAAEVPTLERKDPSIPLEERSKILENMTKAGPALEVPAPVDLSTFGMPRRKPAPLTSPSTPAPTYSGLGSRDWKLPILGDLDEA